MVQTPSEFLSSVTADELDDIIDHDLEVEEAPPSDHRSVIDLVKDGYDELTEFAWHTLARMPFAERMSEDERREVYVYAAIVLGAICRAAEVRDLPEM